jgi:GT2 family glycosyltransferase
MKYSVVFTSYNCIDQTRYFLENAIYHSGMAFELIWVDDCSSENIEGLFNELKPTLEDFQITYKFIKRKENGRWAKAVNDGLREATGDYIFILDNDWLLPDKWLVTFDDYIKKIPNTDIACMKWRKFDVYGWFGENIEINGLTVQKCNKVMGFRCFSRGLFNKVGYLDDRLGWYGPQDSDWSIRALSTNPVAYYIPNHEVLHLEKGISKDKREASKQNAQKLKDKDYTTIYYNPFQK